MSSGNGGIAAQSSISGQKKNKGSLNTYEYTNFGRGGIEGTKIERDSLIGVRAIRNMMIGWQ